MKTLSNSTDSKRVNIFEKDGTFKCLYVQVYGNEEQVLDSKTYARESSAIKWADKKLSH